MTAATVTAAYDAAVMTNVAGRKVLGFVVLTLVLVACANEDPAAGDDTATTAVEAPTTAAAETTTTAEPETTTTAAITTTTEATPTTEQYDFVKPVTITMPSDWVSSVVADSLALVIEAPDGEAGFISEGAETTVDSWVERLIGHDNLETTEPVATDVGGAPGYSFDARIADTTQGMDCGGVICVIIADPPGEGDWVVLGGLPTRIWIVDVAGTAVLIAAEASEAAGFEEFVAAFEEVLATVEWAEAE